MKTLLRPIGSYSWIWGRNLTSEPPHVPNQLKVCFCCMAENICVSCQLIFSFQSWCSESVLKGKNGTKCATEAVTEHEHSKFSHWFLPTWSENYACLGEGSSLSWSSFELSGVWQMKYNARGRNIPSQNPAQGWAASCVLQSSLSIKQYRDWGIGALAPIDCSPHPALPMCFTGA